jgi:chorismate mutase
MENRLEPIRLLIDRDTCKKNAGVIIVLIKERIDLMKKVHILTQEENKLSSKQLEEYMEFAAKNNYELTGELHFHFSNAFYEPEKFVNTIKDLTTSRTFVTDGECIVFANAFSDGRLLKAFEDNGFEVYERDSGRLIQDVFNEFNERQIHTLKAVINRALESVVNNKPLFVTSNSNSEATHDCVREYVSKYDLDHAVVIQLSNLNEEFKKQIGDVIKNEKCDHLVLIEPDSFSKQMQQDVVDFALENNLKVDSYYAQPEVEISLQMKGMVN